MSPYGRVHKLDARPTPELAYLCGVKLGDATQSKGTWNHSYKFKLLVMDKEFTDEFSRCASVVLNCKPFKVWWYVKRGMWYTEVGSIMLYGFLKQGLERFKQIADHCSACAAAFLRGFFDSEASVSNSGLTISNGRKPVLRFVKRLLARWFKITTTGPYPTGPPIGTAKLIKGRLVKVNLQNYVVRVRNASVPKFADSVGFTLSRKARALELLLSRLSPLN